MRESARVQGRGSAWSGGAAGGEQPVWSRSLARGMLVSSCFRLGLLVLSSKGTEVIFPVVRQIPKTGGPRETESGVARVLLVYPRLQIRHMFILIVSLTIASTCERGKETAHRTRESGFAPPRKAVSRHLLHEPQA